MLLRSPERVTVEGITVVSGNVWAAQGVEYTLHVLKILGRADVPLYLGAEAPLLHSAAMADAEAERWGPLEFRGAFAEPVSHIPLHAEAAVRRQVFRPCRPGAKTRWTSSSAPLSAVRGNSPSWNSGP